MRRFWRSTMMRRITGMARCYSWVRWLRWRLTGTAACRIPDAPYDVHDDIAMLKEDLRSLDRHIGELAAYRDFSFLMEHIARDIPKQASGYSR